MRQTRTGLFIGLECSVPQIANQPITWQRQNERGKEEIQRLSTRWLVPETGNALLVSEVKGQII